ncbi:MAG TPA: glycosyltransferase family 2 protein [Actinomycetales bacterium]|nr:glycosyltransferase family 2 protein [Actinomycetales bacterium]
MPDVWVVVPLYNEAQVIAGVVRGLRTAFDHVVCVDDGSHDASAEQARSAGAVVVRHAVNLGQGAALQTGIDYALRDPATRCVVTFDADGQHQVDEAEAMARRVLDGESDAVFGSRFLDSRTRPGLLKRLVLKGAVVYSNLTSGLHLTDAHNGLRALSRSVCEQLELNQNRMAHASQLVEQVGRTGSRVVEHPVHILYTDYSRSKGQSLLNSVNILAELFFK